MKVLTKLVLIIFFGAFLTIAAVGYFVFTGTQAALESSIKDKQDELGRQTINKLDRLIFGYFVGVQNIAEEEHIERTLGGELTDSRVLERRIKELPFLSGPWDVLKIVNTQGTVIVSSPQQEAQINLEVEKNIDNLAALKEALDGHVYYSDFLIAKDTGKPTMIFAAPIHDQEKAGQPIVGAVIGQLAWPVVNELIAEFDPTSEFDLYTHKGVLIATNQETSANLFLKNSEIEKKLSGVAQPINGLEREFEKGTEVLVTRADSDGYLAYKGNQWSLFIETPTTVAFAPAVKTAQSIVLIIFPIILLTMLLKLLLLRGFIIVPVVRLTEVANVIAKGDLEKRADIWTKDEIGELAKSFNAMTDRVQESYSNLKIEKEKIETIIKCMGDGLMVVDAAGKIILWNDAATDITGWNEGEVLGQPFQSILKLVREKDRTSNSDFIIAAIKEKAIKSMENHTLLIRKDGTEVPVSDSAAPVVDTKGIVRGVTVVFRDVTKERAVEQLKTDFLAIASHEMRTPLTLIKGNAERLLSIASKKKDAKSTEMASSIYRNSDRLFNIVNDFLDVISYEERGVPVKLEAFDLVPLAQETVSEIREIAEAKNLYLRMEDTAASFVVMADKGRAKQVLINLLSNAVHHTKKGGITLTLEKQENGIKISVSDTGFGISKENQPLLFKKFGAIRETFMHSKEYGSGLGLYISKLVTEAMGGRIWLEESSPEAGSTFSFILPAPQQKRSM